MGTLRRSANTSMAPRFWQPGEFSQEITLALAEKDSKEFHGGPYIAKIVCLYTGEPLLSFDEIRKETVYVSFGPYRQITAAYLLFRYDVELKACPIMELNLVAQQGGLPTESEKIFLTS